MDSFTRAGLVFDVRDSGPPDAPVVVCLHGFPQDATAFDAVVPVLQEAGLRVLAPDQRGYSPRARPPGRRPYALDELVADTVALLDAAGAARAHVVGHDWGGAVAWALARHHPHRLRALTVLSTPHPAAMQHAALHADQALRSWYIAAVQVPALPEALLLTRGGRPLRALLRRSGLPAPAAEHYTARQSEPGALSAALGWYRALPLPGRDAQEDGHRSDVPGPASRAGRGPAAPVPTAYLWGTRDPFFSPAAVRSTAERTRDLRVSAALEAGHWLPETRASQVADAVLRLEATVRTTGPL